MPSVSVPGAIVASGAIAGGSGLLSGIIGSNAAQTAASEQEAAAMKAIQVQESMFKTIQHQLGPYRSLGDLGIRALHNQIFGLEKTPALTEKSLEHFPGYQFTLNQGLESTQNSYAAQGLGTSGAAMKGAANYAEGLASTTGQQAYEDILQGKAQRYGMLSGLVGTGEAAAGQGATLGVTTAGNIGNLLTSAGAAAAGGTVGSANAITSGLTSATGGVGNAALTLALLQNTGMYGAGAGTGAVGGNLGL